MQVHLTPQEQQRLEQMIEDTRISTQAQAEDSKRIVSVNMNGFYHVEGIMPMGQSGVPYSFDDRMSLAAVYFPAIKEATNKCSDRIKKALEAAWEQHLQEILRLRQES